MESDDKWLKDHQHMILGEKIGFWVELKRQSDDFGINKLIKEIVKLRARVSFLEDRSNSTAHDYKDFVKALDISMKT